MEAQSYKNHVRYYPPHHFVYYPVITILLIISIYFSFTSNDTAIWIFISLIFVVLFGLAFMLRQHYALTLQNRIVKLELRYRYLSLTGERLELIEDQLSDEQIFALRFSPDKELLILIEKTLDENLSGNSIKKSITDWKGDYERV
ncbi:DUF6526 family protein [Flavobacterium sp. LS1R47]|jgi:hypothetical protein|uniref:DUF6526 family protein n=1 Tax=Flavobacterium frigoritolerans TaxID=2987686 RepID=A0A9X3C703_9FLAO|nr:DUF6526 family protein [Flavobacterium frigoritolerans]MCV9933059.1 DUF6526 family protein [Flavobacterium frigoritolerans]